jgi:outer membrane immunogenic protein
MRKLLVLLATLALSGSALAADMAVKAPAATVAGFNWSGFYIGLNAGYGWADNMVNFFNGDPAQYAPALAAGAIPTGLQPRERGFVGGGQAGYNWQSGSLVFGLETDIQYADITGTASTTTAVFPFPSITTTAQNKVDWFGTLRPRVGFVAAPSFLIYATGGLAYGHVSSSASTLVVGPPGITCTNNIFCSAGAASQTRAGWTVGGGLEYALSAPWSIKVEYLYVNLGSETYNMPSTSPGGGGLGMQATTKFQENLVRAGLNYKL